MVGQKRDVVRELRACCRRGCGERLLGENDSYCSEVSIFLKRVDIECVHLALKLVSVKFAALGFAFPTFSFCFCSQAKVSE